MGRRSFQQQTWRGVVREEGPEFLRWLREEGILSAKFDGVATALQSVVRQRITTREGAEDVWAAVPDVLTRCNEQDIYCKPGAADAYAWKHLLDRYARTWLALEELVERVCIPLARYGVRVLDVGTGPGPSAFAIHDFYSAMRAFSLRSNSPKWHQPADVTCVDINKATNLLRHHLAETIHVQSQDQCNSVLSMCFALDDFSDLKPRKERSQKELYLREQEDVYFDEHVGEWLSDPRYTPDEANRIAQSLHRYRLIVFSNFLTTIGTVNRFKSNLVEILYDASPGSVVLVIGGKGGCYPDIYKFVDQLAMPAGFQMQVQDIEVSSSDCEVAAKVCDVGREIREYLTELAPDRSTASHKPRAQAPSSGVRAYWKAAHARFR